jgi:cobyrinic acid a,c-diamide synthase
MIKGTGLDGKGDGLVHKNVLAAYTHLHALGTPEWAPALVHAARTYGRDRRKAKE